MTSKRWDWRCMLPNDVYIQLLLDGLPGWEKGEDGNPPCVRFAFSASEGNRSRAIAIAWDDTAELQFAYGDSTDTGMPFLWKCKTVESWFVFQTLDEAERFHEMFKEQLKNPEGPDDYEDNLSHANVR